MAVEDWQVDKPLGICYATQKVIDPGEEYFGALVETEEGLQRRDFCSDFWHSERPEVFCYWKTRLPSAEQKKHEFIDEDMLMAFFERLAGETDQQKVNFRFVLALVLMRKRRLKYESSLRDGERDVWHLRVTGDKRMVDVTNPNLDDEQIEQLSSQIGQILQTDL